MSDRKKLLVVDDQKGVALVVSRIAEELGFESQVLTGSESAITVFMDFKPDVVMLDMIMPEKDGIDVLNEMLLSGARCRFVLTSGLSNAYLRLGEQIARFHNGARVSVLRKPFRRAELLSALAESGGADQCCAAA